MAMFSDQLRQVLRRLGRAPLFTIITLITLGVGVGANTVIFSVLEGVLLKPLPYPHPEQLIGVWHQAPGVGITNLNMSPSIYFIDREQNTGSEAGVGAFVHARGRFTERAGYGAAFLRILAAEIWRGYIRDWTVDHSGWKAARNHWSIAAGISFFGL
jgi:hypothetical protein